MSEINFKLLDSEILAIPKRRQTKDLSLYLRGLYDEFLTLVGELESEKVASSKDDLINFCDSILESLTNYLAGSPVIAYHTLAEGLASVYDHLMVPKPNMLTSNSMVNLYRARIGTNVLYTKSELFHIPFQIRHNVTTQRYSIPGLPCLYLSDTIYTCWEELKRPAINTLQVSRFELDTNELRFLDLSLVLTHKSLYKIILEHKYLDLDADESLLNYIMTWPLAAACSVVVEVPNAVFKPEYVVPQLLLQWVTNNEKLDGVIFLSSRLDYKPVLGHFPQVARNFVIPTRRIKAEGYCEHLMEKIKFTNPVSWEISTIANPKLQNADISKEEIETWVKASSKSLLLLELSPGSPEKYHETIFGRLEILSLKSEASTL